MAEYVPSLPTEAGIEFRWVPNYPGYCVSSDGRVFSAWRLGSRPVVTAVWKELRGGLDKDGYRKVILRIAAKKYKHWRVNILVLTVFKGERPPGMNCAHDNNVRADNAVSNLRWDTQANNVADKHRHGTRQIGERSGCAVLTEQKVRDIRRRYAKGGITLTALGREYGVSVPTVQAVTSRRNWAYLSDEV